MEFGRKFLDQNESARFEVFRTYKNDLENLFWKAILRGNTPNESIALAIDVEDTTWNDLVEHLNPNYNWQNEKANGIKPVLLCILELSPICNYICKIFPYFRPYLETDLQSGLVKATVMSKGGLSIYGIHPIPQYIRNMKESSLVH